MMKRKTRILKATAQEQRLIESLTATPVFERLDKGELEIVDPNDWSDVPQLKETRTLSISSDLYRRLKTRSRKSHTTPDRLATRWLSRMLDKSAE